MADLIHIFDPPAEGAAIPDGKYHVTGGPDDPGTYVSIINGKQHQIAKEGFENDVETIEPTY